MAGLGMVRLQSLDRGLDKATGFTLLRGKFETALPPLIGAAKPLNGWDDEAAHQD